MKQPSWPANIPEDELFTLRSAHWSSLKVSNIATKGTEAYIPIPGTGGDAQRAFRDILSDWPMRLPRAITEQEFLSLDGAIASLKEAAATNRFIGRNRFTGIGIVPKAWAATRNTAPRAA